jgi:Tfp pilus assembly protein PilF
MYLKINEVDRAYEKFQEAIAIDANHTNCLLALGAIQQTRNEIDSSLKRYRNISNIDNEGFELWSNVGLCFYRKSKLVVVSFYFSNICSHYETKNQFVLGHFVFEKGIVDVPAELQPSL